MRLTYEKPTEGLAVFLINHKGEWMIELMFRDCFHEGG
jgi:hypothetical protein